MVGNWGVGYLYKVEGRGIKWDLIPYVGQLELANVPIVGWIIDPNVCSLLDGPCDFVYLPTHYGDVVHTDVMTHDVSIVTDGGMGPEVFTKPFPESLQILMGTPHHNSVFHTCTCRLLHVSVRCCLCHWGPPGGS